MYIKPGANFAFQILLNSTATGSLSDADALPTALLTRNGVDDGTVAVTVTKLSTGRYKAVGALPNTYVPGDVCQVIVTATVGGVIGASVAGQFVVANAAPTAVQIRQEIDANSTQLAAIVSALALANGMAGINQALLNPVLTAGVLTAYDLCIYDTAAHATANDGVTGLLHKLHVTLGYVAGVQNAQTVTQIS